MSRSKPIRVLIAAVVVLAVAVVVSVLLMATDTLLSVYERLERITPWLGGAYLLALALAAVFTALTAWRLLRPRPRKATARKRVPLDRDGLARRVEAVREKGVDVDASEGELAELDRRRGERRLYLAVYGETSAGKSTLIGALLPDAEVVSDPRTGTTREARVYDWAGDDGPGIRLVDLPGFGQADGGDLTETAREEALRAHVVLYVCDNDLTRSQHREVEQLAAFEKPLIVVLNKADRLRADELGALESRIRQRLSDLGAVDVIPAVAGGTETVLVEDEHGRQQTLERDREPDVGELVAAIQYRLSGDSADLEAGQEKASLQLARIKLEAAERRYRRQQADTLVERYARRAVIGALAAVTPGTDIVIQGALATALMRELTHLYDVSVRDIDLDRFIETAGTRATRLTSITLAVAGNALKAFPGVGTLAGGLVHAVAYGLIFDSLGRAVAQCLDEREELRTEVVIENLERQDTVELARRARHLARLALSRSDDD